MSTHLHSICLTGRGPVINLKFQLYKVLQTDKYSLSQLREDKRNLSFHERHFPLAIFPQGLLASFSNHWYGDWPISSNANFPHLPNEGFPRRIRGSRVLRHTPYSFPRLRHRDGEWLSCTISSTIEVSFLYVVIASCINVEYNLDAKEE